MVEARAAVVTGPGAELGASLPTLPTVPPARLLWGGLVFGALTAAVFWRLFAGVAGAAPGPALGDLRWGYLALLLLLLPVESLTSATRMWLICRVLHPGVSLWTCLQSELANAAIAVLTPSQSGGGVGQIYMLNRVGGVSVGTALTATLLSFMGTMVGLLAVGLYALLATGVEARGPLFLVPVWTLTAIAGALLVGAAWPDVCRRVLAALSRTVCRGVGRRRAVVDWRPPGATRSGPAVDRMDAATARLVDLLYAYRAGVRRFLRDGKACFAAVSVLSACFLLARAVAPFLCARFLGVEAGTFRQIAEAQMALTFLLFFAPTPGGAGIAEGASLSIMADVVPPGIAPHYNLLWRFATAYVAALAGFLCLGRALARDGSERARRPSEPQELRGGLGS